MRDRDIIGAWGFRILASGLLGLLLWNANSYTQKIDKLDELVPQLNAAITMLNTQLASQQGQISKIWDRIFDGADGRPH